MGWKDILRPIRDGLRDNLPPKKPPTDAENEHRRRQDALKSFTYFESFQHIYDWHPDDVRSFQRANTPLLVRPGPLQNKGLVSITLIHDFAGNYHDYENIQPSAIDRLSYSCEYLQSIDSFVYFSHKLVCVPPPSWTNVLHRNGVKSLGTFLVEPQSVDISKILQKSFSSERGVWEYTLASQLSQMAQFYGFDGWLINIEKTFPIMDWSCRELEGFLRQLSSSFEKGCIIWYDSLTIKNRIDYQNGLTEQNLNFVQAAGSMLTNYAWDPQLAARSKSLALQNGLDPSQIMCGIDVWAQNSTGDNRPRETYPRVVGGGTGTGLGVEKLAEAGLSAGIFAPAWSYEHFSSDSRAVERSMWIGEPLPEPHRCDCTPKNRHAIQGYKIHPISKHARESPAGSETFFYTNFARAFQGIDDANNLKEGKRIMANLISQSVLPRISCNVGNLFSRLEDGPSRISLHSRAYEEAQTHRYLKLYALRMPLSNNLVAKITYRKPETPTQLQIWLEFEGTNMRIPMPSQACAQNTIIEHVPVESSNSTLLTGLSLQVAGQPSEASGWGNLFLAEILEICIRPKYNAIRKGVINNVTLEKLDERYTSLRWKIDMEEVQGSISPANDGLPYSNLTGPCSFFVIKIDEQEVGRAYSLEYLLQGVGNEMEVQIIGIGFDGEVLCIHTGILRRRHRQGSAESWQLV